MRTRTVSTADVDEIARVLREGQLVALPTETVYGLAAMAERREAVERIFAVKRRPGDNPVIVHAADAQGAFELAREVPEYARQLSERFWPGPLTLVLPSRVSWPWVQAGYETIAVRVPEPAFLREVIRRVGPLAAPSANLSGRPSPTTAGHCLEDLSGEIPLVVDGGPCPGGLESTVVDCTGPAPAVLRPGPVTAEMIMEAAGRAGTGSAASPGTRHPHYRPVASVQLVDDVRSAAGDDVMTIASRPSAAGHQRVWGSLEELGRNLYRWFREADEAGVRLVLVERVPEQGLGSAIMNRLSKAAQGSAGSGPRGASD